MKTKYCGQTSSSHTPKHNTNKIEINFQKFNFQHNSKIEESFQTSVDSWFFKQCKRKFQ